MRFILLIVGIVTVGAVGVTGGVVPSPTQLLRGIMAPGGDAPQVKTTDFNPAEASNTVLPQILRGHAPEGLGFHGSAVTAPPGGFRDMANAAVNPGAIGQSGFAASVLSLFQQSNNRAQDIATYARKPAGLHGAPAH